MNMQNSYLQSFDKREIRDGSHDLILKLKDSSKYFESKHSKMQAFYSFSSSL